MNTVPFFLLGTPISFKGICTIYPLTIKQRISFDDKYFNSVFMPYTISDDLAHENGKSDVFSLIIADDLLLASFCESLRIVCDAKEFRLDRAGCKILIDKSEIPMDSVTFREFSKIVRDWNCIPIYKPEPEPVFMTEEGRKQWLKLKEGRAKNAKVENDFLGTMIGIVQFGGNSYIDESIIMKWTYWKLVNSYHAIVNSREYEHSFSAYLQGGKKELVKDHWTERLKPRAEI